MRCPRRIQLKVRTMKLCIPVLAPNGLDSDVQPHLPDAEHLFFFDTETRNYHEISLSDQTSGDSEKFAMDAVLCGSINRMTLHALAAQGIKVYGIETQSVAQAIALFESGQLQAAEVPTGGGCGGGGCGGHDHGHSHAGGGCGGGGCGGGHDHGHSHDHAEGGSHCGSGGGCGCGGHGEAQTAVAEKPLKDGILRVAICSQNRKTITEHAGKCRKFWIYDIRQGTILGKTLLELPLEQALHSAAADQAHPLDDVHILIAASMGSGLQQRLQRRGIQGIVTTETDPDQAITDLLETV